MALTPETGAGLAGADSYISLTDAATFHTARGNAAWAALATDALREQALRRATDYMVQTYRSRWAGYRYTSTQALDWPRSGVEMRDQPSLTYYPDDDVPTAVEQACALLALKAAVADLCLDETQRVKSKKIGPIETVYQDYSSATKTYRAIDSLLEPLLAAGGNIRVVRG